MIIRFLFQQLGGKECKFHQDPGSRKRHHVNKGGSLILTYPEIHQCWLFRIKNRLFCFDDPTLEMLQKIDCFILQYWLFKKNAVEGKISPENFLSRADNNAIVCIFNPVDRLMQQINPSRLGDTVITMIVEVDPPDHFVGIGPQLFQCTVSKAMEPGHVPFAKNNFLKKPGTFFPITPGSIIGAILLFFNQQDALVGKGWRLEHMEDKAQSCTATACDNIIVSILQGHTPPSCLS